MKNWSLNQRKRVLQGVPTKAVVVSHYDSSKTLLFSLLHSFLVGETRGKPERAKKPLDEILTSPPPRGCDGGRTDLQGQTLQLLAEPFWAPPACVLCAPFSASTLNTVSLKTSRVAPELNIADLLVCLVLKEGPFASQTGRILLSRPYLLGQTSWRSVTA